MDKSEFNNMIERYKDELMELSKKQKLSIDTDTKSGRESQSQPEPKDEVIQDGYLEFLKQNPKEGELKIQALTSKGMQPVSGANIIVSKEIDDEERIFYNVKTNQDGLVEGLILPAPEGDLSMSNRDVVPHTQYLIKASHPNYQALESINADIFEGIISVQSIKFAPRHINA